MTTIDLQHPLMVNGVEMRLLSMRRPKVRDMLASDKAGGTDAEKEIRIFANLCEVSPEAISEMDMSDYKQLQRAYEAFLS